MVYTPQLSGNEQQFRKPLPTASLANGAGNIPGTEWTKLTAMADKYIGQFGALPLATNASTYRIGQDVQISIDVPAEGYLNVVTVDSQDNTVVLFPNRYHKDNRVQDELHAAGERARRADTCRRIPHLPAGQLLRVAGRWPTRRKGGLHGRLCRSLPGSNEGHFGSTERTSQKLGAREQGRRNDDKVSGRRIQNGLTTRTKVRGRVVCSWPNDSAP